MCSEMRKVFRIISSLTKRIFLSLLTSSLYIQELTEVDIKSIDKRISPYTIRRLGRKKFSSPQKMFSFEADRQCVKILKLTFS